MEYKNLLGWIGGFIGVVWGAIQFRDLGSMGGLGIVCALIGSLIGAVIDKAIK